MYAKHLSCKSHYNTAVNQADTRLHFAKHIPVTHTECTAIDVLATHTPLSRQQLKKAMHNGSVWLQSQHGINRIRRAKKIVHMDDVLHIYYDSTIQSASPPAATLVADESNYSIWDKPCGMYSQGSKWGDHCTLYRWSECHLQPQRCAYPVHRLDRAASGLIIIAHDKKTTAALADMFKHHQISKQYRATVSGDISRLTVPYVIDLPLDDKPAESVIQQSEYHGDTDTSSLTIEIKTGRKHQIRRHLASLGHPIVGDRLYGSADSRQDLQLRSVYIAFRCPLRHTQRCYSL